MDADGETRECWWVIEQGELLKAFRRCSAGESPDVVLLELTANADSAQIEGSS